jgi:hypothetical protein
MPMPITGYRELTAEETDNINKCKAIAMQVGHFVEDIKKLPGIDQRWASIGATDLQKGFMALTRAIAKPETF